MDSGAKKCKWAFNDDDDNICGFMYKQKRKFLYIRKSSSKHVKISMINTIN